MELAITPAVPIESSSTMSVASSVLQSAQRALSRSTMLTPPLFTTVRVNLLRIAIEEARVQLQALLAAQYVDKAVPCPIVERHPQLADVLVAKGSGPYDVQAAPKELYVDVKCGAAVMRGANIYAPGVLGSSASFQKSEKVAVYVDLTGRCRRGRNAVLDEPKLFAGNGVVFVARHELFKRAEKLSEPLHGLAVRVTEPVWDNPSLDGVVANWGFTQNLPSIVSAHVLEAQPGETVLDMCAAPGGKSTAIASLMGDVGRVVCLDRGPGRALKIARNAFELGLESVEMFPFYDAAMALDPDAVPGVVGKRPPFARASFDRVLVDAPCSGLGQRPLLMKKPMTPREMASNEPVQRKLLVTAVELLKPGGVLVYSTCTLREEENEQQVEWLLRKFSGIRLDQQRPHVGKAPSFVNGEDLSKKCLVQKFDPRAMHGCRLTPVGDVAPDAECGDSAPLPANCNEDTIGFFIAKFVKEK